MTPRGVSTRLVLTAFTVMLAACASVDVSTTQYVGVPRYQPTEPTAVQILRTEPTAPHDRLGEIMVDASTDPAPAIVEVEQKLCKAAGKQGADAVVVVYDRVQPGRGLRLRPLVGSPRRDDLGEKGRRRRDPLSEITAPPAARQGAEGEGSPGRGRATS